MVDPWPTAIRMLSGDHGIPDVVWPAERRRVVRAVDAPEPDLELPPEPRTAAADDALLRYLRGVGAVSVRRAAADLAVPRATVDRGLQRLRAAGAAVHDGDGWRVR